MPEEEVVGGARGRPDAQRTQAPGGAAKSDKATVLRRVQDVTRLLLVGGDFDEIRQLATAQGWGVSDRQLRRYQEKAYQRIAESTNQDREQLLARHLMQRRALYARALKTGDLRAALQVLRDEAALERLYEAAPSPPAEVIIQGSSLPRRERFRRLLACRAEEDDAGVRLLEESSPRVANVSPDLHLPELALGTLTLTHIGEQLDRVATLFMALWSMENAIDDRSPDELSAALSAYAFKTARLGWKQFTGELGVDGDWLVEQHYRGVLLVAFAGAIARHAPSQQELRERLATRSPGEPDLPTPESEAGGWREMLDQTLDG